MDIAIHLGAHCTDEDRILKALLADRDMLRAEGTEVPVPSKARPALRKALRSDQGSLLPGGQSPLLADLVEGQPDRVVFSYEGHLGAYAKVLNGSEMYSDADARVTGLRDLFPGHQCFFLMGIRNPATFIPALFAASTIDTFGTFVAGHDLGAMRWSDVIIRIRTACPDVPLVVWCNEDLPLIWPDILRTVSGIEVPMKADGMILQEIMTPKGFNRLQAYLQENPAPNLETWRKVVSAFLGKYVDESKVDEEIVLPGWSQDVIAALTVEYEADLANIQTMADVTFLLP
ncbi:MAG: hypothetical protein AAFY65_03810 [Pseudomonadota bacterium]